MRPAAHRRRNNKRMRMRRRAPARTSDCGDGAGGGTEVAVGRGQLRRVSAPSTRFNTGTAVLYSDATVSPRATLLLHRRKDGARAPFPPPAWQPAMRTGAAHHRRSAGREREGRRTSSSARCNVAPQLGVDLRPCTSVRAAAGEERRASRPRARRWQGSRGASVRATGAGEEGRAAGAGEEWRAAEAARTCYPGRVGARRGEDGEAAGAPPSGPTTREKKGGPPRPRAPAALAASELVAEKMARQPGCLRPGRRCGGRRAGAEAACNCSPGRVRARRGEDAPGPTFHPALVRLLLLPPTARLCRRPGRDKRSES